MEQFFSIFFPNHGTIFEHPPPHTPALTLTPDSPTQLPHFVNFITAIWIFHHIQVTLTSTSIDFVVDADVHVVSFFPTRTLLKSYVVFAFHFDFLDFLVKSCDVIIEFENKSFSWNHTKDTPTHSLFVLPLHNF